MRNHLLSGVAAVAMFAIGGGPGFAQGAMWDGWYGGIHVGAGEADTRTLPHSGETDDGVVNNSPSGVIAGGQVGHNWQMNTFVLGVEGDVSLADWDDKDNFPGNSDRSFNVEVSVLASLRGRLGMTFNDGLFYVTGGLAFMEADYVALSSPTGTLNRGSYGKLGGVIGAGVEWKPTQDLSWRIEGLYYHFDDKDEFGSETPGWKTKFDDAFVVRAGVNVFFSDRRLKRDVTLVSRLDNGLGLYRYRYLWSEQVYVGVIAQEVERLVPEAIMRDKDGYMRVNYDRLGFRQMTWFEWTRSARSDLPVAA